MHPGDKQAYGILIVYHQGTFQFLSTGTIVYGSQFKIQGCIKIYGSIFYSQKYPIWIFSTNIQKLLI